jgi:hypothetical protein
MVEGMEELVMEGMEEEFLGGCTVEDTEREGMEVDTAVLVGHLYSSVNRDGRHKLKLV